MLGGELFEYILARRYLKEKDAKRLFSQLISGVRYMHEKHIVHRDLKLVCMTLTPTNTRSLAFLWLERAPNFIQQLN
jgi:serine/threonine protein kinase